MNEDDINDLHTALAKIISASEDNVANNTLEGIILSNIIGFSDDAIISTTLNGKITSWNRGAELLYGYTRKEAVGSHISILIPPGRADEEPEIVNQIKQGNYVQHYDTQRIRKDGSFVNISLTVSPLKDTANRIIGVSKIARDISSKKKLEEVQSRMADIINYSDDAIISKTLEGTITSWNRGAESIFGYTASEAIGKNITILFPRDRMSEEAEIISKIRKGELVDHYESERVRKDGSRVYISLTISPIKDANGTIIGVSKIARDITERRKKDEEIKQKNRELEAFTYSVSHDLQAPLRRISNFAEILNSEHSNNLQGEGKTLIAKIQNNVKKMRQLIDDLLMLSSVDKSTLNKTVVDMNTLVTEVADEVIAATNSKIQIEKHLLRDALADKRLMRQVWQNLISNAIKYSQKKNYPQIEIGSYHERAHDVYYIKDNGVGFKMEDAEKLFIVFQRLHNSSEFEGTGIGLSIVHHIIHKHGGMVWAEAVPEQGATFYFSLPSPSRGD